MGLGALGLSESVRLKVQWESVKTFESRQDVGGAILYLALVSASLLVCGVFYFVTCYRQRPVNQTNADHPATALNAHVGVVILLLLSFAYLAAIQVAGYFLASLFFYVIVLYILGLRPWWKAVVGGMVTTAGFGLVFLWLAGIEFSSLFPIDGVILRFLP